MQPLTSVVEAFGVQHRVDLRRSRQLYRPAACPGVAKGLRSLATAEKAGPVSGREPDRLVEKEQFCPTAASHHRAAAPPKFAETQEPGLARPAPLQQRSGCGIVDNPAVAGEHAA